MQTVLYRAYDMEHRLLYVGITRNIATRMNDHRRGALWWWQVKVFELEFISSRLGAHAAESKAIHNEKPIYNKVREIKPYYITLE